MFIQGSYYIVLQLYIRSARQIPKFLSGISVIFRAPYKWVLQNTIKYDDGNLEFVKGILHVFWTKMLSAAVPGFLFKSNRMQWARKDENEPIYIPLNGCLEHLFWCAPNPF